MSDKPKKEKKEKKPKEKLPKPNDKKHNKICPNCKSEIPKKAKVCPSCAAKQKGMNPLIIILPVLLVLLIAAAVSIFVFHFPIDPPFELPFLSSEPKYADSVLGQSMELTEKEEAAAVEILTQCGFKTITRVTQIRSDSTSTSYAVQDTDTERFMNSRNHIVVRVDNEEKIVRAVTFGDEGIYLNGEVVAQITDFYLDMAERDKYMDAALEAVKSRLDLPEVASFPSRSHWTFTESEDRTLLTVESTVTTKDGAGTEFTLPFQVRFEEGELASVNFLEAQE